MHMKYFTWEDHKKQLLKDKVFKKAFDALDLEYTIAASLIEARTKQKLSQSDVAKKMNTTQSVISRVERAQTTPSVSFLKRLAAALNIPLRISLG